MSLGRLNANVVPVGNSYKMRPQCYIYRLLTHYYYHLLTMGRRFPVAYSFYWRYLCKGNNEQKCEHTKKQSPLRVYGLLLLCLVLQLIGASLREGLMAYWVLVVDLLLQPTG